MQAIERKSEREEGGGEMVCVGGKKVEKSKEQHTVILYANRSTSPIPANLIIPIRKDARAQTVIKDRVMIILLVTAVAVAAAVTEIVLERDIRGGWGVGLRGDVVLEPVAVGVVDALGLAGVDVGVVPVGKGGVRWHGIVGVVFVADGREAFVVVFAGAVVEGEDLEGWGRLVPGFLIDGRNEGGGGLTPLLETQTMLEECSNIRIWNGRVSS